MKHCSSQDVYLSRLYGKFRTKYSLTFSKKPSSTTLIGYVRNNLFHPCLQSLCPPFVSNTQNIRFAPVTLPQRAGQDHLTPFAKLTVQPTVLTHSTCNIRYSWSVPPSQYFPLGTLDTTHSWFSFYLISLLFCFLLFSLMSTTLWSVPELGCLLRVESF